MQGLNTKSYLTRSLLNRIYKKRLTNKEIEDLILSGEIIKQYSYYKPSVNLLIKLNAIPKKVEIKEFNRLCKQSAFVLKDIQLIFGCNKDTSIILSEKYFYKKHNYWYKNDVLNDLLTDGEEEIDVYSNDGKRSKD